MPENSDRDKRVHSFPQFPNNMPSYSNLLTIFTDAAGTTNENNSKRLAIGIICNKFPEYNYCALVTHEDKNAPFGELIAIIAILNRFPEELRQEFHIVIFTDEKHIVRGLQLINHRQKGKKVVIRTKEHDGWDSKVVEFESNKLYRRCLLEILQLGGECHKNVTIVYVPGHFGVTVNELADIFAKAPLYRSSEAGGSQNGELQKLMEDKLEELRQREEEPQEEEPYMAAYFTIYKGTIAKWGKLESPPHYEDILEPMDAETRHTITELVKQNFGNLFFDEDEWKIKDLLNDLAENTQRRKKNQPTLKLRPADYLRMLRLPRRG